MSKFLLGVGGFGVAIVLLVALVGVGSYITYYNYGVRTENALEAKLRDNQQLLGKHSTQIAEMAQVNEMYRDDLKEVYTAVVEGRYGEDGSQALMQWIGEHNPNFDSALYTSLSQKIQSNRDEFANQQRQLLDMKRAYENSLDVVWSGFWLRMAGFPKMNLDDIVIITSTHSIKAYETGVDDGIKLR